MSDKVIKELGMTVEEAKELLGRIQKKQLKDEDLQLLASMVKKMKKTKIKSLYFSTSLWQIGILWCGFIPGMHNFWECEAEV